MSSDGGTSAAAPEVTARSRTGGLPPGPRLPALVQTAMWVVAPMRFGRACMRRYGPLFTARILGFGDVVYVASPEGIRRVLREDAGRFDAAKANAAIGFVVGDYSLLLSEGQRHTRRRRVLMKPLHGDNVAEYVTLMESVVTDELRNWPVGSTVRLLTAFQRVTLEVMMRAVFGISDSARLARLRLLVPRLLAIDPLIILVPALRRRFGGVGPWARFDRVLREVDSIVFAEITERRADPAARGNDVLSRLIEAGEASSDDSFGDRELRDHMVTLLAVGQETTATQLAWFFERVLRTPGMTGRVRDAVRRGDGDLLDAAIHESIRVRPTTLDLGRVVSDGEWTIEGHRFPPGTMFAVSLGLLHASPELFDRPEEFRPERFRAGTTPRSHFLPFGAGGHRCLGASLAMVEMRTVIGAVLRHADLVADRERDERMAPHGPMLVPGRGAAARITHNDLFDTGRRAA